MLSCQNRRIGDVNGVDHLQSELTVGQLVRESSRVRLTHHKGEIKPVTVDLARTAYLHLARLGDPVCRSRRGLDSSSGSMHRSLDSELAPTTPSLLHAFACTVWATKSRHLNGRSGEELLRLWRERGVGGESSFEVEFD
jgi:hypothetical protein